MFASVLPGIRELRVPLATGFLWLTLAWVWVGAFIPLPQDAQPGGLIEQFYRLSGALGTAAVLAVLVFAAYLVGILMQFFQLSGLKVLRRFQRNESNMAQLRNTLRRRAGALLADSRGLQILVDVLTFDPERRRRHLDLSGAGMPDDFDPDRLREDVRGNILRLMTLRVLEDVPMTAVQLQVQQKDLYGDYDRASAEAEFRLAVALPLGLVILAIGIRFIDGAWWTALLCGIIGGLVTTVLVVRGLQKQSEANDIVLRSIIIGAVDAPIFTLIQEATDLRANSAIGDQTLVRDYQTARPEGFWQRLRRRLALD